MWIGLGSGGQAIIELLNQNASPTAVVFDSSPSDWSIYNDDDFDFEQTALNHFWYNSAGDYSLNRWLYPNAVLGFGQWRYSTSNRCSLSGADSIESNGGWVVDTNSTGHVFVNRDWALAEQTVRYALTGSAQVDDNNDVE